MKQIVDLQDFNQLPDDAVEIGTDWENGFEFPREIRETIEAGHVVYVVREYHYNAGRYEQWSDTYFV